MNIVFGSHNRIRATVTDEDGAEVVGATVTVTVTDGGETVVEETMSDEGGGVYEYVLPPNLVPERHRRYDIAVEAEAGGFQRLVETHLFTSVDTR